MSGSERIRARLEQMDTLDEMSGGVVREVGGLTQSEFTHRLNTLKQEMIQAWNSDQRVKALKIAIQVWDKVKLNTTLFAAFITSRLSGGACWMGPIY